jgi:diguanylate cyclase (GGDEF)-like protein/PAS domain S-box-containing protein
LQNKSSDSCGELHDVYRTLNLHSLSRRFARMSLATKTAMATSILFLASILAIGAASLHAFRSQLIDVVVDEQNTLVTHVTDEVGTKLWSLLRVLKASAREIGEAELASSDAAQHYLDTNTGLFASVDRSVFLFSAEGILVAERPFRPNRRGDNASWRAYIRETIQHQRPVISEPFRTNVGDANMVLVVTMPVFANDGRFIGILSGSLGLTQPGMLGNLAKTVIGRSGHMFITSADGRVIMHPDRDRLSHRAYPPGANAHFDRALAGHEGTELTVDPSGREAFISYRRVSASGWIVGSVFPREEALIAVDALIQRFGTMLLVSCIIVLACVWGLTHRLMRPLRALTSHLASYTASERRIAPLSGVPNSGSGEIRSLTSAFNRLAARLHQREDALIETMRRYQLITENSSDLITKHTPSGTITYASPVSTATLGIAHTSLIERSLFELVHPDDFEMVREAFNDAARSGAQRTVAYRARHADQRQVWLETTMRLMAGERDGESEILCISRDIAERKRMEQRLHELARTDHLTSLPNRFLLEERFAAALMRVRREGSLVAILMIDIDRFKNINDTLGHGTGDALLRLAAAKLKSCLRDGDTLARWGGDEFVVLLPSLWDQDAAIGIARRCLASLQQPFTIDNENLHVSASIGVSFSSDAHTDAQVMLRNADTAMYRAKARGGSTLVVYESAMTAGARHRLTLENGLYQAIERGEFVLHYQPKVSARTGKLAGVEALIRWQHPVHGLLLPGQFIAIAEENGQIDAIGNWVLRSACLQMQAWFGRGLPRMPVAVNLSSRQFREESLAHAIKTVLRDTHFDPTLLELELTESLLMDDVERSTAVLRELKALGVSVALDDFGTGYSSLSYLKGFALDTLKIDRTFTSELPASDVNAAIVRATIALADGLKLNTVAEGVETRAQVDFLVRQGCDVLQGYLFARPMAPDEFLNYALASPTYLFARSGAEERETTLLPSA